MDAFGSPFGVAEWCLLIGALEGDVESTSKVEFDSITAEIDAAAAEAVAGACTGAAAAAGADVSPVSAAAAASNTGKAAVSSKSVLRGAVTDASCVIMDGMAA